MKTFAGRVTCRFAVLVTATTAAILIIGGFLLDRQIVAGLDRLHDVEADELGGLLGADGALDRAGVRHRIKHDADSDAALFVMQVSNLRGDVMFRSDNLADTILPVEVEEAHRTTELPFLGSVYLSTYTRGPWRIQIGSPLQPAERMLQEYVRMSLPLLGLSGLLSVAVGYAFSRAVLRPVRAIEATAKRIRGENLAERIPVSEGGDELAGLALLLNQMFDRLQTSFDEVKRFSADASHELKTPLSLIRLNAERLRGRLADDPEASAAIDDLLEETARIQQVIDRLLFLAQSDTGALQPRRQSLEPAAFLTDLAADAQVLAEDRGVRFEFAGSDPGLVEADGGLIRQVLLNLITNAVAVSPPDGRIGLRSQLDAQQWTLVVTDEGPGMTETQRARAFERFVRFPNTAGEQPRAKGHGLGLAICKSIVDLHGGRIAAENRRDRSGLRVTITLPRTPGGAN